MKKSELHQNINNLPMGFITAIEDLQRLAIAARIPRSQSQMIAIGINIVQRRSNFEKALIEWFEIAEGEETIARFKQHFMAAHKVLRWVRGQKIRNTTYSQANQLMQEVNQNINHMKKDI